jgi:uncharacterized protein YjbI with pentapeptide repeats/DNA-binding LacI/PurR family transcriptional regulator
MSGASEDQAGTAPNVEGTLAHASEPELVAELSRAAKIQDPLERELAVLEAARRFGLSLDELSALFGAYETRLRMARGRMSALLERILSSLSGIRLFTLLEYAGKLTILLALTSFVAELPQRIRQRRAETWQAILQRADSPHSSTRRAGLERLNASCFNLDGLRAPGAHLEGLRLDHCRPMLNWLQGGRSTARGVSLRGAELAGGHLARAVLPNADLSEADLEEADLRWANLESVVLAKARLARADLFRADLAAADLSGANLRGADLSQADLRGANLVGADLTGAVLVRADLTGANLENAVLSGADLAGARLEGAVLLNADLQDASLNRTRLSAATVLDGANLAGADLTRAFASADWLETAENWQQATRSPLQTAKARLSIGLILTDDQYFFQEVRRGAREAALAEDVALVDAQDCSNHFGRIENEKALVAQLIRNGVEAIALAPKHVQESVETVEAAVRSGAAVYCYDQCIGEDKAYRLISGDYETDHFELGRVAGAYLGRWIRSQQSDAVWPIGLFRPCQSIGCFRRVQGFRAGLDESGVRWGEALYFHRGGKTGPAIWHSALVEKMKGQDFENVRVWWSAGGRGTETLVSTVRDLRKAGRARDVHVVGTDISPAIAEMLLHEDEVLLAVAAQNPFEMGRRVVKAAAAAWAGGSPVFEPHRLQPRLHVRGALAAEVQRIAEASEESVCDELEPAVLRFPVAGRAGGMADPEIPTTASAQSEEVVPDA